MLYENHIGVPSHGKLVVLFRHNKLVNILCYSHWKGMGRGLKLLYIFICMLAGGAAG